MDRNDKMCIFGLVLIAPLMLLGIATLGYLIFTLITDGDVMSSLLAIVFILAGIGTAILATHSN